MSTRLNIFFTPFFVLLILSSCARITFKASGLIPAKITPQKNHHQYVEIEGTKEFYFWGFVPSEHTVYVDEEMKKRGLISSTNIGVETYISGLNYLKSIFSLGMYTPVNYKVVGFGIKDED